MNNSMKNGQTMNASTPSTGVQGMVNRKFFGKKSLKPKGKSLAKAKMEKDVSQNLG